MAQTIQEALYKRKLVTQTQFLNWQNAELIKEHSTFKIVEETGGKNRVSTTENKKN